MPVLNREILSYLRKISIRETLLQKELRKVTTSLPESGWEVSPEQGQFLAFLVQITGAKRILEIGTFTGHSSLAMGLALPNDGKIITCDMEPTYTNIAEEYWAKAGITDKFRLLLGPAIDSLESLHQELGNEYFDLAFIDANKKEYDAYYELSLEMLKPHGVIAIDNIFWNNTVLDPNNQQKSTKSIRELNQKLLKDERVSISVLPLNDGLTLLFKL